MRNSVGKALCRTVLLPWVVWLQLGKSGRQKDGMGQKWERGVRNRITKGKLRFEFGSVWMRNLGFHLHFVPIQKKGPAMGMILWFRLVVKIQDWYSKFRKMTLEAYSDTFYSMWKDTTRAMMCLIQPSRLHLWSLCSESTQDWQESREHGINRVLAPL